MFDCVSLPAQPVEDEGGHQAEHTSEQEYLDTAYLNGEIIQAYLPDELIHCGAGDGHPVQLQQASSADDKRECNYARQ